MCKSNETEVITALCSSAQTLQEQLLQIEDDKTLLIAIRATGIPNPSDLLEQIRSKATTRTTGYVLVPVAWNRGNLNIYKKDKRRNVSLFMTYDQLINDSQIRANLFHEADEKFELYLKLWAKELNRRGDKIYESEFQNDEALTLKCARFLASLECMGEITLDSLQPESLLGVPLLRNTGINDNIGQNALIDAIATVADIMHHGTFLDRLKAKLETMAHEEVNETASTTTESDKETDLFNLTPKETVIEGQHFYTDITAQELGASLYLIDMMNSKI